MRLFLDEDIDELVRLAKSHASEESLKEIPTNINNNLTSSKATDHKEKCDDVSPLESVVFEKMPPKSMEVDQRTAVGDDVTREEDEGDGTLTRASAKELAEKFHEATRSVTSEDEIEVEVVRHSHDFLDVPDAHDPHTMTSSSEKSPKSDRKRRSLQCVIRDKLSPSIRRKSQSRGSPGNELKSEKMELECEVDSENIVSIEEGDVTVQRSKTPEPQPSAPNPSQGGKVFSKSFNVTELRRLKQARGMGTGTQMAVCSGGSDESTPGEAQQNERKFENFVRKISKKVRSSIANVKTTPTSGSDVTSVAAASGMTSSASSGEVFTDSSVSDRRETHKFEVIDLTEDEASMKPPVRKLTYNTLVSTSG